MGYSNHVQERGQLLRKLFDEVDLSIEMENLRSESPTLGLTGSQMCQQRGNCGCLRCGSNHVAQRSVLVLDGNAVAVCRIAQQSLACRVDDAYTGSQVLPKGGDNSHTPGSRVEERFEGRSCHRLQLTGEAEYGSCFCNKGIGVEGLGHIHVGSDLMASLTIELLALGGQQNDMDILQA